MISAVCILEKKVDVFMVLGEELRLRGLCAYRRFDEFRLRLRAFLSASTELNKDLHVEIRLTAIFYVEIGLISSR